MWATPKSFWLSVRVDITASPSSCLASFDGRPTVSKVNGEQARWLLVRRICHQEDLRAGPSSAHTFAKKRCKTAGNHVIELLPYAPFAPQLSDPLFPKEPSVLFLLGQITEGRLRAFEALSVLLRGNMHVGASSVALCTTCMVCVMSDT